MCLIIFSLVRYHEETNSEHLATLHLMRIQDCVGSLSRKNVEMMMTPCQHPKKMRAQEIHLNLVGTWKVVVIGYASGLLIGVILGCVMNTSMNGW